MRPQMKNKYIDITDTHRICAHVALYITHKWRYRIMFTISPNHIQFGSDVYNAYDYAGRIKNSILELKQNES